MSQDTQAVEEHKEIKTMLQESTKYYFSADDTPTHEDDWTEQQGESGDYWTYEFEADELGLLEHYLTDAEQEEVDRVCHVLVLSTGNNNNFHHALFSVLKEFR